MICAILSSGREKQFDCKNENESPYPEIKNKLREYIWELYRNGYTDFVVNCEYGIPMWAAEIICALKMYNDIGLHIVVPYEEQTTNWSEDKRNRYFSIHEKADTVEFSSNCYFDGCYEKADELMREKCDKVVYFDKI